MAHKVKCVFCGQTFDRDIVPSVKLDRRYAHKTCADKHPELVKQENDKEEFYDMVASIYGPQYNYLMISKQVDNFMSENPNYTYSGMTKCLKYFYKILGNSIEDGHGGVGIIPYIYDDVYQKYYQLHLTDEKNKNFKPSQEIEISIQSPRTLYKEPLHLLNLDEEE